MSESEAGTPWVAGRTVGSVVQGDGGGIYPDRDAVVFPARVRWSWRELDRRVDGVASALMAAGSARPRTSASGR